MKKFLMTVVMLMVSTFTFAAEGIETKPVALGTQIANENNLQQQQSSTAAAQSNGGGGGAAVNAGNHQTINFNSPEESKTKVEYSGTQTVKNVPNVSGVPLTTSNDTCMGSTSGSVNVAGFGGSYGTTWTDSNCVMLKNGRELWNMGMRAAGLARLCYDKENRDSLEMTGYECPQTRIAREAGQAKSSYVAPTSNVGVIHPELTDPRVRDRMGYPPLQ